MRYLEFVSKRLDLTKPIVCKPNFVSLSQQRYLGKFRSTRRPPINKKHDLNVRVNEEIDAARVRVVDEDGQIIGIMSAQEALDYAIGQGLDLIEIAPKAEPPVCKVIDLGKYRYEQQKREKQQKKSQHQQHLKEIRFKAATDTHDFDFKTRHAREFLLDGDKVKASVMFRGREIVHSALGIEMLKRFVAALEDVSKIDQEIKMEGSTCSVILSPEKKVPGTKKAGE